jgi:hypothetical protein
MSPFQLRSAVRIAGNDIDPAPAGLLCTGQLRPQASSPGRDPRLMDPPFIAGQLMQSAWAQSPADA